MSLRVQSKPRKGEATAERRARAARIKRIERRAKDAAKRRDGYLCRRCGFSGWRGTGEFLEAAHLDTKGMGGDHGLHSSLRSDYVTLCHDCHQGPLSVHRGLQMVYGPLRGDGPVEFVEKTLDTREPCA